MVKRKKDKRIPVLLLEDLVNLGQRGEIVLVKPGYFRYLISQKKVVLATREKLENELKPLLLEEKIKSREKKIQELKDKIENLTLEFKINQYTPKITKEKILKTLREKGINLSKNQIELEKKIDSPGEENLKINLGFNFWANLRIKIVKS